VGRKKYKLGAIKGWGKMGDVPRACNSYRSRFKQLAQSGHPSKPPALVLRLNYIADHIKAASLPHLQNAHSALLTPAADN
jgi:hypothetical protein